MQNYLLTHEKITFKAKDMDSYHNFREVMQILDCAILDIQTVQYKPKVLTCSLLYLILGKNMGEFSRSKIVNECPKTSTYLFEESDFNSIFSIFISERFGLTLF